MMRQHTAVFLLTTSPGQRFRRCSETQLVSGTSSGAWHTHLGGHLMSYRRLLETWCRWPRSKIDASTYDLLLAFDMRPTFQNENVSASGEIEALWRDYPLLREAAPMRVRRWCRCLRSNTPRPLFVHTRSRRRCRKFDVFDVCAQVVLHPGDALFVPFRWMHYAESRADSASVRLRLTSWSFCEEVALSVAEFFG